MATVAPDESPPPEPLVLFCVVDSGVPVLEVADEVEEALEVEERDVGLWVGAVEVEVTTTGVTGVDELWRRVDVKWSVDVGAGGVVVATAVVGGAETTTVGVVGAAAGDVGVVAAVGAELETAGVVAPGVEVAPTAGVVAAGEVAGTPGVEVSPGREEVGATPGVEAAPGVVAAPVAPVGGVVAAGEAICECRLIK